MNRIIKSREAATAPHVRPLVIPALALPSAQPGRAAAPAPDPELTAARVELDQARASLAAKDVEIGELVQALKDAFAEGEAHGRQAALKAAAETHAALGVALRGAGEKAVAALKDDLAALEDLAVTLALRSLERVLGEPGAFTALAGRMIRTQLARLECEGVLQVCVSPADFAGPDALAALGAEIGHPGLEIAVDGRLASGDCTIKLVLGTLEIGANQQWARLQDVLTPLPRGAL